MRKYFEKILNESQEVFLNRIKQALLEEKKMFIITANPETLMIAEKDEEFKKIVLSDDATVVADGIGIIKGAKMLDIPLENRILGVDLVNKLLDYCNEFEKSIYLFGAKEEVIQKMKEIIEKKYVKAKLVGANNGYVENKQEIFEDIKQKKPDVILVALGIPNQEKLIAKNYLDFEKGIFIGVGGSFDVISGVKKRAPKFFIKFNLEWLYRITTEPKRLKRFFQSNIKYIFKIRKEKRYGRNEIKK